MAWDLAGLGDRGGVSSLGVGLRFGGVGVRCWRDGDDIGEGKLRRGDLESERKSALEHLDRIVV